MNYKLAKQLKDAGFKQKGNSHQYITTNFEIIEQKMEEMSAGMWGYPEPPEDLGYYIPTLPELIDACGDKFDSLSIGEDKKWICMGGEWSEDYGIEFITEGETYDIAVAKLLLELYKGRKKIKE